MTLQDAIAQLEALSDAEQAAEMLAYHKIARRYLGVRVPHIDTLTRAWREVLDLPGRVDLARRLWASDIHEARIAAAKLLTQVRIKGDGPVWDLITEWLPDLDAWAIADHAMIAAQKRLVTDPLRIDEVEGWTTSPSLWIRRAALVATLPWTKQNHPKAQDLEIRDRVLGWAATYADDREWFVQKAIAWWLRELSKHDAPRVEHWIDQHGARLKPFARKEALRHLRAPSA